MNLRGRSGLNFGYFSCIVGAIRLFTVLLVIGCFSRSSFVLLPAKLVIVRLGAWRFNSIVRANSPLRSLPVSQAPSR